MFWLRWTLVCLVGACVLVNAGPLRAREAAAVSAAARGNEEPHRGESRAKRRGKWYGYQTLAADAAAGALILAAGASDGGGELGAGWLVWPGIAAYFVGAPLVHWAHGGHATLRSFGLRLLPPAVTAVGALGCYASANAASQLEYVSPPLLLGIVIGCGTMLAGIAGFPAVVVVDAAVFAYEPVKPPPQSLVLPSYDPTRRAGMLTWAGTF